VVLAAIYATAALLIIGVVGGHLLAYRAAGARKSALCCCGVSCMIYEREKESG